MTTEFPLSFIEGSDEGRTYLLSAVEGLKQEFASLPMSTVVEPREDYNVERELRVAATLPGNQFDGRQEDEQITSQAMIWVPIIGRAITDLAKLHIVFKSNQETESVKRHSSKEFYFHLGMVTRFNETSMFAVQGLNIEKNDLTSGRERTSKYGRESKELITNSEQIKKFLNTSTSTISLSRLGLAEPPAAG